MTGADDARAATGDPSSADVLGLPDPEPTGGPTGSRLDDLVARLVTSTARRRVWWWAGPVAVTLLGAVLRLAGLGSPHALVFDETYYVKDSWTLIHLGYEGAWPDGADKSFTSGDVDVYTSAPEFVAHPPLGKWLIGAGLALTGAQDAVGWRLSTAVLGTVAVLMVALIARTLTGSAALGTVAGLLMAIDGNAIVMSRVALLDGSVMVLALAGFACVIADRRRIGPLLAAALARRRAAGRDGVPVVWRRPWLVAAGVALGAASAVKWSGVYFLAVFGVYLVVAGILERRRLGTDDWWGSGIRQAVADFVLLVPVAVVVYLGSWSGWLLTRGGYYRDWVQTTPGARWGGGLAWVPNWAQDLYHYHAEMYGYSINLHTPHPYQSNPLTWLLMIRPTSMYYQGASAGQDGCTAQLCSSAITGLGNPLIWWGATLAVVWLVYRAIRYRERRACLVLTGLAAGWLPWVVLYSGRTIFEFYSIAFEPYLILALTFALGAIAGRASDPSYQRVRGLAVVGVFLVACLGLSAWFLPLWTAQQTSYAFWDAHIWFPSWR